MSEIKDQGADTSGSGGELLAWLVVAIFLHASSHSRGKESFLLFLLIRTLF